jgi:hypothetical protein
MVPHNPGSAPVTVRRAFLRRVDARRLALSPMTILDSARRRELQSWYEATTYRFVARGCPGRIRIGEICPQLDAILVADGMTEWAFVSAANPGSEAMAEADNAARHADLVRWLDAGRLPFFEGAGVPDEPGWPVEPSVLILGMPCPDAVALARRLGQNAILCGRRGGVARLVWVVT